jgi:hypothetical protein
LNPKSKGGKNGKGKAGSVGIGVGGGGKGGGGEDDMPTHKKEFERFHAENGVRTVIGQIGPVKGGMYAFILLPLLFTPFPSTAFPSPFSSLPPFK